ncbi:MAG: hypothetical protein ACRDL5_16010 [Solirubrobacteraceae bacterium]
MKLAVIIPTGPGVAESQRCRDTVASVTAWEPAVRWLVLVDDSPVPRDLGAVIEAGGAEVTLLAGPLAGRQDFARSDRLTAGVLAALRWVARETDADMALELDTDALVIAPFADKLAAAAADERTGLVGSYDRTCNGEPRSFQPWAPFVQAAARNVQRRRVLAPLRTRRVRRYILQARSHGYEWGEHALGCSIAIPRPALDALDLGGSLDDPLVFAGTHIGDDPMLGILVRRAGYRLAGHVGEGQTFGVAWRGLPDTPVRLAARGYSIIHSVRSDPRFSEQEVRALFRRARERDSSLQPGSDARGYGAQAPLRSARPNSSTRSSKAAR